MSGIQQLIAILGIAFIIGNNFMFKIFLKHRLETKRTPLQNKAAELRLEIELEKLGPPSPRKK